MWLTWLGVVVAVMWLRWIGVVVVAMWWLMLVLTSVLMVVMVCWLMLIWLCFRFLDKGPPHYIAVARALGSVCVKLSCLIHEHCWTSVSAMAWPGNSGWIGPGNSGWTPRP